MSAEASCTSSLTLLDRPNCVDILHHAPSFHPPPKSRMNNSLPTRGQLERNLSQKIQAFYRTELGHQPSKVTCRIFDDKVVLVLEDSITPPEQLLADKGREAIAEQVRADLNAVLGPQLKTIIEEIMGEQVVDLLTDAKIDTGRTGTIAILKQAPAVRSSRAETRSEA